MGDREKKEKALRDLDEAYGSELRQDIRRSPACCEDPEELVRNVFRDHHAQHTWTVHNEECRPRSPAADDERKAIYHIARGLLIARYREWRASFSDPAQAVEELKERALARVEHRNDDLAAALAILPDEVIEVYLLGLPSKFCTCEPERCMHRFTNAEIADATDPPGDGGIGSQPTKNPLESPRKNLVRTMRRKANAKLKNNAGPPSTGPRGDAR
ncbi:hypothetical protein [Virgisporangium aurantiacum]|uniref:Uncharacterized protein n=1 Tax=Virgisporangium aurantiacum TaxID=175570 RepID=A0A8J3ZG25_9ACTN|nr:hypothetical protein [Virgisporangium aurantiacum]GIJ63226.1 hypothetical protein Vau01_107420 [Virgisporangium aurantiacum]